MSIQSYKIYNNEGIGPFALVKKNYFPFYVFALIYLILCPLIVARMLGFVINPLTHRLV